MLHGSANSVITDGALRSSAERSLYTSMLSVTRCILLNEHSPGSIVQCLAADAITDLDGADLYRDSTGSGGYAVQHGGIPLAIADKRPSQGDPSGKGGIWID
jgi:hypothetical protein